MEICCDATNNEIMKTAKDTVSENEKVRVYSKRWIMLILSMMCSISSMMHIVQYITIADVIQTYYGASLSDVNWTSLIVLLVSIPGNFLGAYVIQHLGLRNSLLIALIATTIGGGIKVASIHPDRFWIFLLGQTFIAISQIALMPTAPKLAATWFGDKEVSTACSIGILSSPFSIALGFLLPPFILQKDNIETGLYTVSILYFLIALILLPFFYFFFENEPPTPPSLAQTQIKQKNADKSYSFVQSVKILFTNYSYILLLIAYSINIGFFYCITTFLNDFMLHHYPGATKEVGIAGLLSNFGGIAGALCVGLALDKFKRLKATTWITYGFYLLSVVCFRFLIDAGIAVVYVTVTFLGMFLNGFLTLSIGVAVELTYPISESTSCGILIAFGNGMGIVCTYLYTYLYTVITETELNCIICAIIIIADILIIFIKFNLKRTNTVI